MASAIELVGGEDGLKKEILLATSSASKLTGTPAEVNLAIGVDEEQNFQHAFIPVAVSLEGEFQSIYAHLLPPEGLKQHAPLLKQSKPTRQVVVAAGSIIRNEWHQGRPLALGYDRYTQTQFGNRDFIVNSVLYLTDDEGWLALRQKEVTLRLINDQRARQSRITAQIISIVVPLMILGLVGSIMIIVRRRKNIK
jgi:ABC-2 type transport system permease protein